MNPEKQLFNAISGKIKELQALMQSHVPVLEQSVNSIIATQSADANEIEHLLDTLLDFHQMGVGEALFLRLLEYYKTLDPDAAADYRRYFEEE